MNTRKLKFPKVLVELHWTHSNFSAISNSTGFGPEELRKSLGFDLVRWEQERRRNKILRYAERAANICVGIALAMVVVLWMTAN